MPLLTIAIPTYNRAARLDAQLAWLKRAISGHEIDCEVILSDNRSRDETMEVFHRWAPQLPNVHVNQNARNIGALGNIHYCLNAARGDFVWVVGDDDEVRPDALAYVVNSLRAQPDLHGLMLNFSVSGRATFERVFEIDEDQVVDGKEFVESLITERPTRYFSLAFMTAQIYRAKLARIATNSWPSGTWNYDYQLYVTAYCALGGKIKVAHELWCNYNTEYSCYFVDPRAAMQVIADPAEVMVHLVQAGYSRSACAKFARKMVRRFRTRNFLRRAMDTPSRVPGTLMRYASNCVLVHIVKPENFHML